MVREREREGGREREGERMERERHEREGEKGKEGGRKGDQKQTIGVMEQHRLRMRSLTSAFHTCAGIPHVQKPALGVSVWLLFSLSVGYLSVNDRRVFYFSAAS